MYKTYFMEQIQIQHDKPKKEHKFEKLLYTSISLPGEKELEPGLGLNLFSSVLFSSLHSSIHFYVLLKCVAKNEGT